MQYSVIKDVLIRETDNIFTAVQLAIKHEANIHKGQQILLRHTDTYFKINYHAYEFEIDLKHQVIKNCPIRYYPNSQRMQKLEFHSGAYNYLYSNAGYQMLSTEISLSKAIYKPSEDGSKWNGYIIINHKAIDEIDFGLIAIHEGDYILFKPFMYYMGGKIAKQFKVYDDYTITKMTKVSTNTYSAAADIKIEMAKIEDGWEIAFINLSTDLTTKIQFCNASIHIGRAIDRFLIGVSLCPVNEQIWNPLSKAAFANVAFKQVILNHKEKLYPGSTSMSEGFSQGVPFSYYRQHRTSFSFSTVYDEALENEVE